MLSDNDLGQCQNEPGLDFDAMAHHLCLMFEINPHGNELTFEFGLFSRKTNIEAIADWVLTKMHLYDGNNVNKFMCRTACYFEDKLLNMDKDMQALLELLGSS